MDFDDRELEQFLTDGYVMLRNAFSREVAGECREFVWRQVLRWENCTTHGQPMVTINGGYSCPPFDTVATDEMYSAFDQLLGKGRWRDAGSYGYWQLLFPGFSGPGGWHLDGSNLNLSGYPTEFRHGLVRVCLFSDLGPDDGGTVMVRGSHLAVGRIVAGAGESGITWAQVKERLDPALLNPEESQIARLIGDAGDVALLHPFLIHGFGPNRGNRIRFACNPLVSLREPVNLQREHGSLSVLELAMRQAIG